MKIAVTYENGIIFQHFGHTKEFQVFEVKEKEIISSEIIPTEGEGHGALSGFLKEKGVEILICGGIGGGAIAALAEAGIKLYGGVSGETTAAVEALVNGTLVYNPNVTCSHHAGDHDCSAHHGDAHHTCGHHCS